MRATFQFRGRIAVRHSSATWSKNALSRLKLCEAVAVVTLCELSCQTIARKVMAPCLNGSKDLSCRVLKFAGTLLTAVGVQSLIASEPGCFESSRI